MKELSNTLMEKSIVFSPIVKMSPLSGGSISVVELATLEDQSKIIIKKVDNPKMLLAEAEGLKALENSKSILVPKVLYHDKNVMVMEYIPHGKPSSNHWYEFGKKFALLHLTDHHQTYGFHHDNFIGRTPQRNTERTNDWCEFFLKQRLTYQINLASSAELKALFEKKINRITSVLSDPSIMPSLVHGDLWSGNALFNENGEGFIIDPAVYYGDGEVDLAMSELFGGFPSYFYQGYESLKPFSNDYQRKKNIYNLYHIINHYNIFGGGYLTQAFNTLKAI